MATVVREAMARCVFGCVRVYVCVTVSYAGLPNLCTAYYYNTFALSDRYPNHAITRWAMESPRGANQGLADLMAGGLTRFTALQNLTICKCKVSVCVCLHTVYTLCVCFSVS